VIATATQFRGEKLTMLRKLRPRATLFVRVFLLLLVTVSAAQAMNFALLLLVPSPEPRVATVSDIATMLKAGGADPSRFTVKLGDAPADNFQDPRELQMTAVLARALELAPEHARVVLTRPSSATGQPMMPEVQPRDERGPGGALSTGVFSPARSPRQGKGTNDNIIVGGFEAGVQMPDGNWRVIEPVGRSVDPWKYDAFLALLCTLLIVAAIAWFFARRLSRPIEAFVHAAEQLGKDPRSVFVDLSGPPEIAAAAAALNDMQARLKRYVESRTLIVGAMAHDLRTPLMRLALRFQTMPDHVREASLEDMREINSMIDGALEFVRDVSEPAHRQRLALRSLIETVANDFIDQGADVVVAEGEEVTLDVDVLSMKRLLANIIGNAILYGERARISLTSDSKSAIIEVEDDGPGIAEAELERVFEPFYRVEQSRNRSTGGTGLGLASSRGVALAHGGDIVLRNREGTGLIVRVLLPL